MASLLAGNGAMATDFRTMVPDSGGLSCGNVLAKWIDEGCRLDEKLELEAAAPVVKPAVTVRHRIYLRKDGKVFGMGVPH